METSFDTITATLRGIRPIMFDRYGGDNKTKLPDLEKAYLNELGQCGIPVLNVFSLLSAENTPSVAKRFYGKQGRDVAQGIKSFCNIEATEGGDSMFAILKDAAGVAWTMNDPRIKILSHVARLPKGIPNPKTRPMIPTGWSVQFKFELQQNTLLNLQTLKTMVEQGGILGLGTFRPIFGRYSVSWVK
jgi:hypothetical protein